MDTRSSFPCKVCQLRVSHFKGSVHSKYLYVSELNGARPRIVRVRVADGAEATAADVAALKTFADSLSPWFTPAPGSSIIVGHLHQAAEIVRATW